MRVLLQSWQKVLIWAKQFLQKFNLGSKNAEVDADFESVEKIAKKSMQKKLQSSEKIEFLTFYFTVDFFPAFESSIEKRIL
jgi:hypothetical protein